MKVLFVCSGNVTSFEIVPFIKEQGGSLIKKGIDISYFPVANKGLIGYVKSAIKLRKFLKKNHFDIIHGHFILSGWVAVIGSRKTPVILSLMGSDAYGNYVGEKKVLFSSRYLTLLTLLIQPFVKAIISKSQNIENYVYLKNKSSIIPNGIDTHKFKCSSSKYVSELNLKKDKKYILFLGKRSNLRKNYNLVKKAVSLLDKDDVELINPYPVSHDIIPKYLNSVNVLAMSSFMEGSPNVIKEAMACNCPIVATDVGDVRWVLGDSEGCFISSFQVEDFAEKLRHALRFSEIKNRTEGIKRINLLGLDSETIAERVIEIYKKSISDKS